MFTRVMLNTLVYNLPFYENSQWAICNPTLVAVYELKGAPRVCKNIDLPVSSI